MSSTQTILPRWKGFNLLEMFTLRNGGAFHENDFRWISDWGFDFVRLPMSYRWWTIPDTVTAFKEEALEQIDTAIEYGKKYGIHVSINFHRAPGYSVNPDMQEPFDLWKDAQALDAFCTHWTMFAKRYRGIASERLSFDLVNEPPAPSATGMTRADHERVVRAAVAAIHHVDAERRIIADGLSWGNDPIPEVADLPLAQSCRAYMPMGISHYKASWVGGENWPLPTWPLQEHDSLCDRGTLEAHYQQWAELARKGVGVHCGEGGAFRYTPHEVVLSWFADVLDILKAHNIGFSLWNFRGTFGILDSEREDVAYEEWHGHKLDRALLELLRKS